MNVNPFRWSPAWAWLALAVFVLVYVVIFDVHASLTGGKTMSGQFHDWMVNPTIGPIIFGAWAAIFVGLTYHFFQYRGK